MSQVKRVYLPLWVAWFSQLFVIPVWLLAGYQVFFTAKGRGDLGIEGWLLMTLMMAAISTMLFLMGYRKLPTYIIEEEEK